MQAITSIPSDVVEELSYSKMMELSTYDGDSARSIHPRQAAVGYRRICAHPAPSGLMKYRLNASGHTGEAGTGRCGQNSGWELLGLAASCYNRKIRCHLEETSSQYPVCLVIAERA